MRLLFPIQSITIFLFDSPRVGNSENVCDTSGKFLDQKLWGSKFQKTTCWTLLFSHNRVEILNNILIFLGTLSLIVHVLLHSEVTIKSYRGQSLRLKFVKDLSGFNRYFKNHSNGLKFIQIVENFISYKKIFF